MPGDDPAVAFRCSFAGLSKDIKSLRRDLDAILDFNRTPISRVALLISICKANPDAFVYRAAHTHPIGSLSIYFAVRTRQSFVYEGELLISIVSAMRRTAANRRRIGPANVGKSTPVIVPSRASSSGAHEDGHRSNIHFIHLHAECALCSLWHRECSQSSSARTSPITTCRS